MMILIKMVCTVHTSLQTQKIDNVGCWYSFNASMQTFLDEKKGTIKIHVGYSCDLQPAQNHCHVHNDLNSCLASQQICPWYLH